MLSKPASPATPSCFQPRRETLRSSSALLENKPFNPAEPGFEFSIVDIEACLKAVELRRGAEQMKFASGTGSFTDPISAKNLQNSRSKAKLAPLPNPESTLPRWK